MEEADRLRAAIDFADHAESLPHRATVVETLRYVLNCTKVDTSHVRLLYEVQMATGEFLLDQGISSEAVDILKSARRTAEHIGIDSIELGALCNLSGVACKALGSFDEAESLYGVAEKIFREKFGAYSDEYATVLHNIAGLAHARGRAEEGVSAAEEALRIRVDLHGEDHVLTAADAANLGGLLFDSGRHEEAVKHFNDALRIFRREYGQNHFEVAVNINNLASVARLKGDSALAEKLFREALSIKEICRGITHPDTLLSRYNLAHLLADLDRYAEARNLLDPVLDGLRGMVSGEQGVLRKAELLEKRISLALQ
ncbi:tetratricopeptide repeat protein [Streptomyces cinereoruber]|uniref:tetratricopeptide repeat protein n=1 Tax=Streptomyces cinereoruber TaxID=67260 RepID=UPI0036290225